MFLYLHWNLGVSGVPEIYNIPVQVKKLGKETQAEDRPVHLICLSWLPAHLLYPLCSAEDRQPYFLDWFMESIQVNLPFLSL